jgi:hypothetical protein
MCVIAYKPLNVAFPEERILKNCFENNSDGAGFMYTFNGEVHIQKGYETFESFLSALNKARNMTGDKVPYVMHFRIATQGYEKTMTHPFPLSSKMNNLKKLKVCCNIGVAHNGIIDLTSDGSHTYSDTMKFITDYLSDIIQSYEWYKNKRTCRLIEKLISGSRLAILDANGHCQLLGKGWEESKGVYFSNNSYAREPYHWGSKGHWNDDWWDDDNYDDGSALKWDSKLGRYVPKQTIAQQAATQTTEKKAYGGNDPWGAYFNSDGGVYEFNENCCPLSWEFDGSYCSQCSNCAYCSLVDVKSVIEQRAQQNARMISKVKERTAQAQKAVKAAKAAASM